MPERDFSDNSGATRKSIARKAVAPWRRFRGAHRCALQSMCAGFGRSTNPTGDTVDLLVGDKGPKP